VTPDSSLTAPSTPAAPGARRLLVFGGGVTEPIALPGRGALVLGRAPDCDVHIDHPSVSRRHCRLDVDEQLAVEDLGAVNATIVGGRRLTPGQRAVIATGEPFQLGDVVALVQGSEVAPAAPRLPAGVVAADPAMRRVFELAARLGLGDVPILILGETGVGKELVAEAVHRASPRAAAPLVRVNCAALAPTLVASELFGHEKGAFTGADRAQPGLFEAADGGTLFLDEIGDLPAAAQAALLRVVESREVMPVGGRKPRTVDVRLVAATHHDLRERVAAGEFRADLFYRLDGFTLKVPPLRERAADIAPLVARFAPVAVSPAALAALEAHPWPGNVRELRHVIASAALLAGAGPIEPAHLPPSLTGAAPSAGAPAANAAASPVRSELADVERRRIVEALAAADGNQTRAAELLGMPRRTLVRRLAEYNIRPARRPR
jgi:two-component system, NtrC family, response regulator AtoC